MKLGEFHGYYCPFRESCKTELGGDEPQCETCTKLDEKLKLAFSSILKKEKNTTMDRDTRANDSELTPREVKIDEVTKRIHQLLEWACTHPKSPWISVKNRLPETECSVLLHFVSAVDPQLGFLHEYEGNKYWILAFCYKPFEAVDYWMPIPKIPK